jgi:hypothetical protein
MLTQQLPTEFMLYAASMPYIGNQQKFKKIQNFKRLLMKMKEVQSVFTHFANSQYIYDCSKSLKLF